MNTSESVIQYVTSESSPYRIPVFRLQPKQIRFSEALRQKSKKIRIVNCDFNTNYYNISLNNNIVQWLRRVRLDNNVFTSSTFHSNVITNPYFDGPNTIDHSVYDEWHLCTLYIPPKSYKKPEQVVNEMNTRFIESVKSLFEYVGEDVYAYNDLVIANLGNNIYYEGGSIDITDGIMNNVRMEFPYEDRDIRTVIPQNHDYKYTGIPYIYSCEYTIPFDYVRARQEGNEWVYDGTTEHVTQDSIVYFTSLEDSSMSDLQIVNARFRKDKFNCFVKDGRDYFVERSYISGFSELCDYNAVRQFSVDRTKSVFTIINKDEEKYNIKGNILLGKFQDFTSYIGLDKDPDRWVFYDDKYSYIQPYNENMTIKLHLKLITDELNPKEKYMIVNGGHISILNTKLQTSYNYIDERGHTIVIPQDDRTKRSIIAYEGDILTPKDNNKIHALRMYVQELNYDMNHEYHYIKSKSGAKITKKPCIDKYADDYGHKYTMKIHSSDDYNNNMSFFIDTYFPKDMTKYRGHEILGGEIKNLDFDGDIKENTKIVGFEFDKICDKHDTEWQLTMDVAVPPKPSIVASNDIVIDKECFERKMDIDTNALFDIQERKCLFSHILSAKICDRYGSTKYSPNDIDVAFPDSFNYNYYRFKFVDCVLQRCDKYNIDICSVKVDDKDTVVAFEYMVNLNSDQDYIFVRTPDKLIYRYVSKMDDAYLIYFNDVPLAVDGLIIKKEGGKIIIKDVITHKDNMVVYDEDEPVNIDEEGRIFKKSGEISKSNAFNVINAQCKFVFLQGFDNVQRFFDSRNTDKALFNKLGTKIDDWNISRIKRDEDYNYNNDGMYCLEAKDINFINLYKMNIDNMVFVPYGFNKLVNKMQTRFKNDNTTRDRPEMYIYNDVIDENIKIRIYPEKCMWNTVSKNKLDYTDVFFVPTYVPRNISNNDRLYVRLIENNKNIYYCVDSITKDNLELNISMFVNSLANNTKNPVEWIEEYHREYDMTYVAKIVDGKTISESGKVRSKLIFFEKVPMTIESRSLNVEEKELIAALELSGNSSATKKSYVIGFNAILRDNKVIDIDAIFNDAASLVCRLGSEYKFILSGISMNGRYMFRNDVMPVNFQLNFLDAFKPILVGYVSDTDEGYEHMKFLERCDVSDSVLEFEDSHEHVFEMVKYNPNIGYTSIGNSFGKELKFENVYFKTGGGFTGFDYNTVEKCDKEESLKIVHNNVVYTDEDVDNKCFINVPHKNFEEDAFKIVEMVSRNLLKSGQNYEHSVRKDVTLNVSSQKPIVVTDVVDKYDDIIEHADDIRLVEYRNPNGSHNKYLEKFAYAEGNDTNISRMPKNDETVKIVDNGSREFSIQFKKDDMRNSFHRSFSVFRDYDYTQSITCDIMKNDSGYLVMYGGNVYYGVESMEYIYNNDMYKSIVITKSVSELDTTNVTFKDDIQRVIGLSYSDSMSYAWCGNEHVVYNYVLQGIDKSSGTYRYGLPHEITSFEFQPSDPDFIHGPGLLTIRTTNGELTINYTAKFSSLLFTDAFIDTPEFPESNMNTKYLEIVESYRYREIVITYTDNTTKKLYYRLFDGNKHIYDISDDYIDDHYAFSEKVFNKDVDGNISMYGTLYRGSYYLMTPSESFADANSPEMHDKCIGRMDISIVLFDNDDVGQSNVYRDEERNRFVIKDSFTDVSEKKSSLCVTFVPLSASISTKTIEHVSVHRNGNMLYAMNYKDKYMYETDRKYSLYELETDSQQETQFDNSNIYKVEYPTTYFTGDHLVTEDEEHVDVAEDNPKIRYLDNENNISFDDMTINDGKIDKFDNYYTKLMECTQWNDKDDTNEYAYMLIPADNATTRSKLEKYPKVHLLRDQLDGSTYATLENEMERIDNSEYKFVSATIKGITNICDDIKVDGVETSNLGDSFNVIPDWEYEIFYRESVDTFKPCGIIKEHNNVIDNNEWSKYDKYIINSDVSKFIEYVKEYIGKNDMKIVLQSVGLYNCNGDNSTINRVVKKNGVDYSNYELKKIPFVKINNKPTLIDGENLYERILYKGNVLRTISIDNDNIITVDGEPQKEAMNSIEFKYKNRNCKIVSQTDPYNKEFIYNINDVIKINKDITNDMIIKGNAISTKDDIKFTTTHNNALLIKQSDKKIIINDLQLLHMQDDHVIVHHSEVGVIIDNNKKLSFKNNNETIVITNNGIIRSITFDNADVRCAISYNGDMKIEGVLYVNDTREPYNNIYDNNTSYKTVNGHEISYNDNTNIVTVKYYNIEYFSVNFSESDLMVNIGSTINALYPLNIKYNGDVIEITDKNIAKIDSSKIIFNHINDKCVLYTNSIVSTTGVTDLLNGIVTITFKGMHEDRYIEFNTNTKTVTIIGSSSVSKYTDDYINNSLTAIYKTYDIPYNDDGDSFKMIRDKSIINIYAGHKELFNPTNAIADVHIYDSYITVDNINAQYVSNVTYEGIRINDYKFYDILSNNMFAEMHKEDNIIKIYNFTFTVHNTYTTRCNNDNVSVIASNDGKSISVGDSIITFANGKFSASGKTLNGLQLSLPSKSSGEIFTSNNNHISITATTSGIRKVVISDTVDMFSPISLSAGVPQGEISYNATMLYNLRCCYRNDNNVYVDSNPISIKLNSYAFDKYYDIITMVPHKTTIIHSVVNGVDVYKSYERDKDFITHLLSYIQDNQLIDDYKVLYFIDSIAKYAKYLSDEFNETYIMEYRNQLAEYHKRDKLNNECKVMTNKMQYYGKCAKECCYMLADKEYISEAYSFVFNPNDFNELSKKLVNFVRMYLSTYDEYDIIMNTNIPNKKFGKYYYEVRDLYKISAMNIPNENPNDIYYDGSPVTAFGAKNTFNVTGNDKSGVINLQNHESSHTYTTTNDNPVNIDVTTNTKKINIGDDKISIDCTAADIIHDITKSSVRYTTVCGDVAISNKEVNIGGAIVEYDNDKIILKGYISRSYINSYTSTKNQLVILNPETKTFDIGNCGIHIDNNKVYYCDPNKKGDDNKYIVITDVNACTATIMDAIDVGINDDGSITIDDQDNVINNTVTTAFTTTNDNNVVVNASDKKITIGTMTVALNGTKTEIICEDEYILNDGNIYATFKYDPMKLAIGNTTVAMNGDKIQVTTKIDTFTFKTSKGNEVRIMTVPSGSHAGEQHIYVSDAKSSKSDVFCVNYGSFAIDKNALNDFSYTFDPYTFEGDDISLNSSTQNLIIGSVNIKYDNNDSIFIITTNNTFEYNTCLYNKVTINTSDQTILIDDDVNPRKLKKVSNTAFELDDFPFGEFDTKCSNVVHVSVIEHSKYMTTNNTKVILSANPVKLNDVYTCNITNNGDTYTLDYDGGIYVDQDDRLSIKFDLSNNSVEVTNSSNNKDGTYYNISQSIEVKTYIGNSIYINTLSEATINGVKINYVYDGYDTKLYMKTSNNVSQYSIAGLDGNYITIDTSSTEPKVMYTPYQSSYIYEITTPDNKIKCIYDGNISVNYNGDDISTNKDEDKITIGYAFAKFTSSNAIVTGSIKCNTEHKFVAGNKNVVIIPQSKKFMVDDTIVYISSNNKVYIYDRTKVTFVFNEENVIYDSSTSPPTLKIGEVNITLNEDNSIILTGSIIYSSPFKFIVNNHIVSALSSSSLEFDEETISYNGSLVNIHHELISGSIEFTYNTDIVKVYVNNNIISINIGASFITLNQDKPLNDEFMRNLVRIITTTVDKDCEFKYGTLGNYKYLSDHTLIHHMIARIYNTLLDSYNVLMKYYYCAINTNAMESVMNSSNKIAFDNATDVYGIRYHKCKNDVPWQYVQVIGSPPTSERLYIKLNKEEYNVFHNALYTIVKLYHAIAYPGSSGNYNSYSLYINTVNHYDVLQTPSQDIYYKDLLQFYCLTPAGVVNFESTHTQHEHFLYLAANINFITDSTILSRFFDEILTRCDNTNYRNSSSGRYEILYFPCLSPPLLNQNNCNPQQYQKGSHGLYEYEICVENPNPLQITFNYFTESLKVIQNHIKYYKIDVYMFKGNLLNVYNIFTHTSCKFINNCAIASILKGMFGGIIVSSLYTDQTYGTGSYILDHIDKIVNIIMSQFEVPDYSEYHEYLLTITDLYSKLLLETTLDGAKNKYKCVYEYLFSKYKNAVAPDISAIFNSLHLNDIYWKFSMYIHSLIYNIVTGENAIGYSTSLDTLSDVFTCDTPVSISCNGSTYIFNDFGEVHNCLTSNGLYHHEKFEICKRVIKFIKPNYLCVIDTLMFKLFDIRIPSSYAVGTPKSWFEKLYGFVYKRVNLTDKYIPDIITKLDTYGGLYNTASNTIVVKDYIANDFNTNYVSSSYNFGSGSHMIVSDNIKNTFTTLTDTDTSYKRILDYIPDDIPRNITDYDRLVESLFNYITGYFSSNPYSTHKPVTNNGVTSLISSNVTSAHSLIQSLITNNIHSNDDVSPVITSITHPVKFKSKNGFIYGNINTPGDPVFVPLIILTDKYKLVNNLNASSLTYKDDTQLFTYNGDNYIVYYLVNNRYIHKLNNYNGEYFVLDDDGYILSKSTGVDISRYKIYDYDSHAKHTAMPSTCITQHAEKSILKKLSNDILHVTQSHYYVLDELEIKIGVSDLHSAFNTDVYFMIDNYNTPNAKLYYATSFENLSVPALRTECINFTINFDEFMKNDNDQYDDKYTGVYHKIGTTVKPFIYRYNYISDFLMNDRVFIDIVEKTFMNNSIDDTLDDISTVITEIYSRFYDKPFDISTEDTPSQTDEETGYYTIGVDNIYCYTKPTYYAVPYTLNDNRYKTYKVEHGKSIYLLDNSIYTNESGSPAYINDIFRNTPHIKEIAGPSDSNIKSLILYTDTSSLDIIQSYDISKCYLMNVNSVHEDCITKTLFKKTNASTNLLNAEIKSANGSIISHNQIFNERYRVTYNSNVYDVFTHKIPSLPDIVENYDYSTSISETKHIYQILSETSTNIISDIDKIEILKLCLTETTTNDIITNISGFNSFKQTLQQTFFRPYTIKFKITETVATRDYTIETASKLACYIEKQLEIGSTGTFRKHYIKLLDNMYDKSCRYHYQPKMLTANYIQNQGGDRYKITKGGRTKYMKFLNNRDEFRCIIKELTTIDVGPKNISSFKLYGECSTTPSDPPSTYITVNYNTDNSCAIIQIDNNKITFVDNLYITNKKLKNTPTSIFMQSYNNCIHKYYRKFNNKNYINVKSISGIQIINNELLDIDFSDVTEKITYDTHIRNHNLHLRNIRVNTKEPHRNLMETSLSSEYDKSKYKVYSSKPTQGETYMENPVITSCMEVYTTSSKPIGLMINVPEYYTVTDYYVRNNVDVQHIYDETIFFAPNWQSMVRYAAKQDYEDAFNNINSMKIIRGVKDGSMCVDIDNYEHIYNHRIGKAYYNTENNVPKSIFVEDFTNTNSQYQQVTIGNDGSLIKDLNDNIITLSDGDFVYTYPDDLRHAMFFNISTTIQIYKAEHDITPGIFNLDADKMHPQLSKISTIFDKLPEEIDLTFNFGKGFRICASEWPKIYKINLFDHIYEYIDSNTWKVNDPQFTSLTFTHGGQYIGGQQYGGVNYKLAFPATDTANAYNYPTFWVKSDHLCITAGDIMSGQLTTSHNTNIVKLINDRACSEEKAIRDVPTSNLHLMYDTYFNKIRECIELGKDPISTTSDRDDMQIIDTEFECIPVGYNNEVKPNVESYLDIGEHLDVDAINTLKLPNVVDFNDGDLIVDDNRMVNYTRQLENIDDYYYNFTNDNNVWYKLGFNVCNVTDIQHNAPSTIHDRINLVDDPLMDPIYLIKGKYYSEQIYRGPVLTPHEYSFVERQYNDIGSVISRTRLRIAEQVNVLELSEHILTTYFYKLRHHSERMPNINIPKVIEVKVTQSKDVEKIINSVENKISSSSSIAYHTTKSDLVGSRETIEINKTLELPDDREMYLYLTSPLQKYAVVNSESTLMIEYLM